MAVGRYKESAGYPEALAYKWTSTGGWERQTLTFPPGDFASELGAVSCPTSSWCTAVGDYHNSGGLRNLAEEWSAGTWSSTEPPMPAGGGYPALGAISCPKVGECMAIGVYRNASYVLLTASDELAASTWTVRPMTHPAGATNVVSYSDWCASLSECIAVGSYENSVPTTVTLAEEWTSSWGGLQSTQNPGTENWLHAVTCVSSAEKCVAVGQTTTSGVTSVLGEEVGAHHTWSTLTMATLPAGTTSSSLDRVSCPWTSLNYCLAVGSYVNGGVTTALLEGN